MTYLPVASKIRYVTEFAPEILLRLGPLPVTNTLVNTIFVDGVIFAGVWYLQKHIQTIPGVFQNIVEIVTETFYDLTESVAGKNTAKIFPYFMSFFLFILIANWSGLIPGFSSVGFFVGSGSERHLVPFLRSATSDLNLTLGLSLISLVATHALSINTIGLKEYLSRYFSLNPINLFVGLLEIISEITKVISLSFRLFGNILAGEVVLATIASLFAFLFPIPFMLLEVIVGLVQSLIFAMLTMVFMSILMTPHHGGHEAEEVIAK